MCLSSASDVEYSHVTTVSTYYFFTDILKVYFLFLCVLVLTCVCVCVVIVCVCVISVCSACGCQKTALDLLELELLVVVSCSTWRLGSKVSPWKLSKCPQPLSYPSSSHRDLLNAAGNCLPKHPDVGPP